MSNSELVEALCGASVPLREARRVHVESYGLLIPHVFMAEVLKRIGQCLRADAVNRHEAHGPEMRNILGTIERGMEEGDRETRNVISISFTRDSELELFFDELRPMLGPRTRAQLQGR
jgi:hypothetical protein